VSRPNQTLQPAGPAAGKLNPEPLSCRPGRLSFSVRHPSRSEALDPTVTELLPNDTQAPTDTDHPVLPSLSDPNNIRRTTNEALNKYLFFKFVVGLRLWIVITSLEMSEA
jgi:hypothetical protein